MNRPIKDEALSAQPIVQSVKLWLFCVCRFKLILPINLAAVQWAVSRSHAAGANQSDAPAGSQARPVSNIETSRHSDPPWSAIPPQPAHFWRGDRATFEAVMEYQTLSRQWPNPSLDLGAEFRLRHRQIIGSL